jgi:hypothetical protein
MRLFFTLSVVKEVCDRMEMGSKVSNSDYGLDNRRIVKIVSLERSSSVFRLALWPIQALIQWVPGPLWA